MHQAFRDGFEKTAGFIGKKLDQWALKRVVKNRRVDNRIRINKGIKSQQATKASEPPQETLVQKYGPHALTAAGASGITYVATDRSNQQR